VWWLAVVHRAGLARGGNGLGPPEQELGAQFSRDVDRDGAGGCGRPRDQTRRPTRSPLGEIGASLGRTPFQHQIPLVSVRARWRFDRLLWRSTYRASARRPGVPPNPDPDRLLTDVHRSALLVRCRL